MKKFLALVLAFAMVFTSIPVVFADTEVSAEAKALALLGMLEGDGGGVTVEYTSRELTRLGAAAALLKLKGLYDEAIAFQGEDNFADVKDYAWVEGRNLMAYLKANPALGFGGDEKGNFNPGAMINEQSYYKVLLETLGYKQTTAEVTGDFAWEEVFTFAESVGLKPAKVEKFTIDELAKATFAALKATTKDGKVYIDTLIAAGVVTEELAVAAGVKEEAKAVDVAVKSVKAIGNTVVEVEFEAEVEKAAAENLDNYSIEGLEIKSALLDGTKKVLLETSAQTAGKTYTLVVGDLKVNFGGAAKVSGAPELKKVTGTDTETVELEFDKVLDTVSAKDVANYTISGVTVKEASLNSARKVVTLTTEGLVANKSYTIKVTNVKSVDGVALKAVSKTFVAKSDKLAPKIKSVKADTNTRFTLEFSELVTKESAENVENYTVKTGSTELAVVKVVDVTESGDDTTTVEVTTESQKSGARYEVSVVNVVDQSVLGNVMTKPSKATFTGKAVDKQGPVFTGFEYITREKVKVTFSDSSRLDKESALNVNNYTFNNDINVLNVELMPGADDDFDSVLLTVDELGAKPSYELKVSGVQDEYGNEMKEKKISKSFNKTTVGQSSKVEKIYATKANELKIEFSKELNPETAKDVANYSINKGIGTPLTAKISSNLKTVTLTTAELTAGKTYEVTIDGVKDLADNVLTGVKVKVVGLTTANDFESPEVEDVYAVNRKVVRVTFSEPVTVANYANYNEDYNTTPPTPGTSVDYVEIRPYDNDSATPIRLYAKVSYEDNTVVEFSTNGVQFTTDENFIIVGFSSGIKDRAGNLVALPSSKDEKPSFYSVLDNPELLTVNWEQSAVNTFKFTFSEKVVNKVTSWNGFDVKVDSDDKTIGYLKKSAPIKVDTEFSVNLNNLFVSNHNVQIENLDGNTVTKLYAGLEDTEAPYIEKVEAVDNKTIEITYNEDLKSAGKYTVSYYDDNSKERFISTTTSLDDNVVTLTLTGSATLDSRISYTLKVTGVAADLANNKSEDKDEEYTFAGTDIVAPTNYLTIDIINGEKFVVKALSGFTTAPTYVRVYNGDELIATTDSFDAGTSSLGDEKITVTLVNAALSSDIDYTVKVSGFDDVKFTGIVDSTSVVLTKTSTPNEYKIEVSGAEEGDVVIVIGDTSDSKTVLADDVIPNVTVTSDSGKVNVIVKNAAGVVKYYNIGEELPQ